MPIGGGPIPIGPIPIGGLMPMGGRMPGGGIIPRTRQKRLQNNRLPRVPKIVMTKTKIVDKIKIAFGVIIAAASGASKFNQHLKSKN